ncbi:MAG: hypothetical protein K5924_03955 [Chloroflexi bacterium]|nr:hypothetical protein [Chloroflexota bacterium]
MLRPRHLRRPITAACVGLLLLAGCARAPSATVDASGASPSVAPQTASASPSANPTVSAAPPSEEPSSDPTLTTMTATFPGEGGRAAVVDVVPWDGGFLAIGHGWPAEFLAEIPQARLWISPDGSSWAARPIDLGVEHATLVGVVVRADGRLLVVGASAESGAIDPSQATPAAWTSADGDTWEPIDLPMQASVSSIDQGARGYALTAGNELWFSADGETWTMTTRGAVGVRAGDEGFVAVQVSGDGPTGAMMASADGQTWFTSPVIVDVQFQVAPLGRDWLATGYALGHSGDIGVWRSENGLDWTRVLDVNDLTPDDGPKTGRGLEYESITGARLVTTGTHAFLTLTNNHCCVQLPWTFGVWTTTDGDSWDVVTDDDAFVETAATNDSGTIVMGGFLRRGAEAAFWRLGDQE